MEFHVEEFLVIPLSNLQYYSACLCLSCYKEPNFYIYHYFNARTTAWGRNDITTTESTLYESTASLFGLSQIIYYIQSQIYLIISNLILMYWSHLLKSTQFSHWKWIHSPLYNNYHHQVAYVNSTWKFNILHYMNDKFWTTKMFKRIWLIV